MKNLNKLTKPELLRLAIEYKEYKEDFEVKMEQLNPKLSKVFKWLKKSIVFVILHRKEILNTLAEILIIIAKIKMIKSGQADILNILAENKYEDLTVDSSDEAILDFVQNLSSYPDNIDIA